MSGDPREKSERFRRGREALTGIMGEQQVARLDAAYNGIAPDMVELLVSFGFGDIYSRPGLKPRDRQLATIAALTALGTAAPQLRSHIKAGLAAGLTREEIVEVLMQMAVYAGFPAALNGLAAAKEAFAESEGGKPDSGFRQDSRRLGLAQLALHGFGLAARPRRQRQFGKLLQQRVARLFGIAGGRGFGGHAGSPSALEKRKSRSRKGSGFSLPVPALGAGGEP